MPSAKKTATKTKVSASAAKKKTSTAKKAPVRKTTTASKGATKKRASAKKSCNCSARCKPEHAFWVHGGPIVRSRTELIDAFSVMTVAQYEYHTKRDGNDFARWLRDCFCDDESAVLVEGAKTKTSAARTLQGACCK